MTELKLTTYSPAEEQLAGLRSQLVNLTNGEVADAKAGMKWDAEIRGATNNIAELRKRLTEDFPDDNTASEWRRAGREEQQRLERAQTGLEEVRRRRTDRAPELERLRREVRLSEAALHRERIKQLAAKVINSAHDFRNGLWDLSAISDEAERLYPQHEFFEGTHDRIPARNGAPAIQKTFTLGLMDATGLLLRILAEWDKMLFRADDPDRRRAEHIIAVEQHAAKAGEAVQRQRAGAVPARPVLLPQPPADLFEAAAQIQAERVAK